MRYELSLSAYDPDLGQGENAESNLLFLGLRTVLYADATQVGGRTHRDVLEELQRKIDALTDDSKRRVYDPATAQVVEVPRNRLRPEGGVFRASKVEFELLKTAVGPIADRGGMVAKVAGFLQRTIEAATPITEEADAPKAEVPAP